MSLDVSISDTTTLLATLLIIVGLFFMLVSKANVTGKFNVIVSEKNSKTIFRTGVLIFLLGLSFGTISILRSEGLLLKEKINQQPYKINQPAAEIDEPTKETNQPTEEINQSTEQTNQPTAKIKDVQTKHNVQEKVGDYKQYGMKTLVTFNVYNLKNKDCEALQYFYLRGEGMKPIGARYSSPEEILCARSDVIRVKDDKTTLNNVSMFIPYDQFARWTYQSNEIKGRTKLQYYIRIKYDEKVLDESGPYDFYYTPGNI